MQAGLTHVSVPHAPTMAGLCFLGQSASACARLAPTAQTVRSEPQVMSQVSVMILPWCKWGSPVIKPIVSCGQEFLRYRNEEAIVPFLDCLKIKFAVFSRKQNSEISLINKNMNDFINSFMNA